MNPFQMQTPIPNVKRILAVGSGKGGVGKSTVSVNLALALKKLGHKVGLLDADIYGPSIPRLIGSQQSRPEIDEKQKLLPILKLGLKSMSIGNIVDENMAVIWRGPMLFKAMDQFFKDVNWGELDYLVVDMPPGTGDVALTMAQKVPVNGGIVVCTPQNLALADAKKAMDLFEKVNIPILGVVENMAGFAAPGRDELLELYPKGELDLFLKTHSIAKLSEIPFYPALALTSEASLPIVEADPKHQASDLFLNLAREIEKKVPV